MATHALVLTAAGTSSRFGGGLSKVLVPLAGVAVLARAARAFRQALGTLPTIVTARTEDLEAVRHLVHAEPSLHGAVVIPGGASRQESVARGVAALPAGIDIVLVHDAARPLVTVDLVRLVAEAAARDGAAAPALPIQDSVHVVDGRERMVKSLPRESLRAVQTPQAARLSLLHRAFEKAARDGVVATDEVALLVAAGVPVTAVPGDPENVKITVPADLLRAEEILSARNRQDSPA